MATLIEERQDRFMRLQAEQYPLDIKIQLAQDELFRAEKKVRARGNKTNYDRLRAATARLKTLEAEKKCLEGRNEM